MSETPTESIFQPSTSFDSQNWLETLGILCMEVDVLNLCHKAVPNNAEICQNSLMELSALQTTACTRKQRKAEGS